MPPKPFRRGAFLDTVRRAGAMLPSSAQAGKMVENDGTTGGSAAAGFINATAALFLVSEVQLVQLQSLQ